jgi:AP-1-like factor
MASAGAGTGGSLPPNFFLTPQQQNLLFAALNSNKPQSNGGGLTLSPNSFETSPMQSSNNEGKHNDNQAFNESPFLDSFNEDPGDSSFDFSFLDDQQPRMIGELPQPVKSESSEPDHHEKRSHPDDEEDDSQEHKRRESTEKVPKKPGRKPLTNEPTSVGPLVLIPHP